MLKQITSLIILGAILFVFYYEFLETPFLNVAELNTSREKAVDLANQGQLDKSIVMFQALIDVAPNDGKVWGDYLLVILRSEGEQKALTLLSQKPLDLIPQYAFKELFEAAMNQGDEHLAFQLVQKELLVSDNYSEIALHRSSVFADHGYKNYAYEVLQIAHSQSNFKDDKIGLAKVSLILESDSELAQSEIKKIIDQGSENKEIWNLYVDYWIAQARQGRLKQSISSLADYVEKAPNEIKLSYDYMVLLTWDENFSEAENIYDQLQKKEHMPDYARAAAAQTLYRNGRVEESEQLYRKLFEEDPGNIEYKKGLAKSLIELNRADESLLLLQPVSQSVDNDVRILIGLAQQASGDDLNALDSLSVALNSQNKQDQRAYAAWLQSFKNIKGKHSFKKLWSRYGVPLKNAPIDVVQYITKEKNQVRRVAASPKQRPEISYLDFARLQAAIARQQGRPKDAVSLYKKALVVKPDDKELSLGLALAYIDLGMLGESRPILDKLNQRYPYNKDVQDALIYFGQQSNDGLMLAAHLRNLAELSNEEEQEAYIRSWINVVSEHEDFTSDEHKVSELNKLSLLHHPKVSLAKAGIYFKQNNCDNTFNVLSEVPIRAWHRNDLGEAAYYLRSCGYLSEALHIYEAGMTQYPNDSEFFAGALLVAAENKPTKYSKKIIACCANKFSSQVDFLLAQAYFNRTQQNYSDALTLYNKVLSINSNNQEAYVSKAIMLAKLNKHDQAFETANKHSDWFSDADWSTLHELRVKHALTQAINSDYFTQDTFSEQAILYIDEQLAFLNKRLPNDSVARTHALFNKVHAYNLANMPHDAINVFNSIDTPETDWPAWGVVHAAEAYENVKQPEKAISMLEEIKQGSPQNLHLLSVLFSSYLAIEDYDQAGRTLNSMNETVAKNSNNGIHWVTRLNAMFKAYQNKLEVARNELLSLQQKDPNDQNISANLATLYRWQGLPNKAADILSDMDKNRVDEIEYEVSVANVNLDLQKFSEAEGNINALSNKAPKNKGVKQLNHRWALHNSYQYVANFQYGESSGNTFGNKDFTFDQRVYSKPFNHHYRVYFRDRYDWAEFPEDNGNLHRVGIGGEFRNHNFDITAELNVSARDDRDVGISVNGLWRLGDHWRLFGEIQTYSHHVPLRAINAGIDGESATAGFQYRWNDSRYIRASASYADFSDGNKRTSVFLQHQHDIFQSAHHQVYLSEEFYASDNSENDVGYFNPEQDYSFRIAAKYYGILWRRYEKSYVHRLTIGAGNYKQKNHSNAGIWDIEYQHQWTPYPSTEIKYGVLHRRRYI